MTPDDLRKDAYTRLGEALADLDRQGVDHRTRAYFYFDATTIPGKSVAIAQLRNSRGLSEADATREVEETISTCKKRSMPFAVAAMMIPEEFLTMLSSIAASSLDSLRTWLEKPYPADHFRLVLIAGANIKAEHVQLKPSARAPRKPN